MKRMPLEWCLAGAMFALLAGVSRSETICPFCSAVQQTISEQMGTSDAVVLAEIVELPLQPADPNELPKGRFRVIHTLKGSPEVVPEGHEFRAITIGQFEIGDRFLVMGVDPPSISWTTPMKLTPRGIDYLKALPGLPAKGVERLRFFQEYLEDSESMLAFDAYDEFARASYAEVLELKPWMNRPKLLKWLQDPEVSTNRKRLYYTLLGVCGQQPEDVALLESLIVSGDKEKRRGLDALVACYLTLHGEEGLPLIEREFFANPNAEYVDAFAAISAIRFHGTENRVLSRDRILASLRTVLDRPQLADLVIPDLARWEDWSVIDKLVTLFAEANEETKWVRVPVVSYLRVCPKLEAAEAIEKLKAIDAESVRRADALLNWDTADEDEGDSAAATDPSMNAAEATQAGDAAPSKPEGGGGTPEATEARPSNPLPDAAPDAGRGGDSSSAGVRDVPIYQVQRLPLPPRDGAESGNLAASVSPETAHYVSTASPAAESPVRADADAAARPSLVAAPVASVAPPVSTGLFWTVLLVPLVSSIALFGLLWSVLNGWFERLIF